MSRPVLYARIDDKAIVVQANSINTAYQDIARIPLLANGAMKADFVELFFRWTGLSGGDAASTFHLKNAARWGDAGPAVGVDIAVDGDAYNHFRLGIDGQNVPVAPSDHVMFTAGAAPAAGSVFRYPVLVAGGGYDGNNNLFGRYLAVKIKNPGVAYANGALTLEVLVY